jgi:hypothetical protein
VGVEMEGAGRSPVCSVWAGQAGNSPTLGVALALSFGSDRRGREPGRRRERRHAHGQAATAIGSVWASSRAVHARGRGRGQ